MSPLGRNGHFLSANRLVSHALEILSMVLLTSGVLLLGFYATQGDFAVVFTGYSLAFLGYALAIHLSILQHTWQRFFILAIMLRAVLIFSFPALSDDIFRFIWDGRLMHWGIHPLQYTPEQLLRSPIIRAYQMQELYDQLNSPRYFTVYPPVSQFIFYLSTFPVFRNIVIMTFVMKLFLFAGEGLLLYGLYRAKQLFRLPEWTVLLYILNPLAIVEVMGNMHFEGLMIAFLLWSGLFMYQKKWTWAGVFFGLSVGVKLLPLMFLPVLIFYLRNSNHRKKFLLGFMGVMLLIFIPYIGTLGGHHFVNSLGLYYTKFEFNAGIYYLFRALGYEIAGYNLIQYIGPAFGLCAFLAILFISYRARRANNIRVLPRYLLVIYLIFAFLSMTLHPWYLLLPLFLTVFVPNAFIPVWTYLITLTYINYSYFPYREVLWIVGLEYSVVFALMLYTFFTVRWVKKI